MSEDQLDQVLQTAARHAQRAAAAALDVEGQLAAAKAAAGPTPVEDGPAGNPDAPESGPEGWCAVPVISLRLIACKLDRALKMARDLTRDLLPFYQHDLGALNERASRQDLVTFRNRVLFPRGRGGRLSRSRARGASLGGSLEYEFAPRYQTLHSAPSSALGIARVLDRDRRLGLRPCPCLRPCP